MRAEVPEGHFHLCKIEKSLKRANIKWANMKKGKYKYQRGSGAAVWAGVSGLAALGSG